MEPEEIRENWRVVTPALSASEVAAKSELLSNECIEFNTYNLEKIVQGGMFLLILTIYLGFKFDYPNEISSR